MIAQGVAQIVSEKVVRRWLINPSLRLAVAMVLLFLVGTSALSHRLQSFTNSPDEMVARAFIHAYATTGSLRIPAPDIAIQEGLAPRSVSIDGDAYVPATFYGLLVLYGGFAAVMGEQVLWIVTPLLVSIACLAFYGLLQRMWGERIAMTSVLLFCLHPAVWYYTARGLYPNMVVLSLVLIGLWCIVAEPVAVWWRSVWARVLSQGIGMALLALAAWVRPIEMVWVALLLIAAACVTRAWKDPVLLWTWTVMVVGGLIVLVTVPSLGALGGYVVPEMSVWQTFFPFGIHPRLILHNVWTVGVGVLGFIGVVTIGVSVLVAARFVRTRALLRTARGRYIAVTAAWIWYPVVLYGSWAVQDNPTAGLVTIGTSYLRYWLPVFVATLPLIAYALWRVFERYRSEGTRYMAGIWMGFFVLWCAASVISGVFGSDGIAAVLRERDAVRAIQTRVLERVPEASVMLVDKWDKHFWPSRTVTRVRKPLPTDVWFFGLVLRDDEAVGMARTMEGRVIEVQRFGSHALYHIER